MTTPIQLTFEEISYDDFCSTLEDVRSGVYASFQRDDDGRSIVVINSFIGLHASFTPAALRKIGTKFIAIADDAKKHAAENRSFRESYRRY